MRIRMLIGPTAGSVEDVAAHAAEALVASGQAVWDDGSPVHPQKTTGGYKTGPKRSQIIPDRTPEIVLDSLEMRLPPFPSTAPPTKGPERVPSTTPPVDLGETSVEAETGTPHPGDGPVLTTTPGVQGESTTAPASTTGDRPADAETVPATAPETPETGGKKMDVKDVTPKGDGGDKESAGQPGTTGRGGRRK